MVTKEGAEPKICKICIRWVIAQTLISPVKSNEVKDYKKKRVKVNKSISKIIIGNNNTIVLKIFLKGVTDSVNSMYLTKE